MIRYYYCLILICGCINISSSQIDSISVYYIAFDALTPYTLGISNVKAVSNLENSEANFTYIIKSKSMLKFFEKKIMQKKKVIKAVKYKDANYGMYNIRLVFEVYYPNQNLEILAFTSSKKLIYKGDYMKYAKQPLRKILKFCKKKAVKEKG